jgi:predicted O-linked N-acetylglucosamine transferase (SPINDLY family)
MNPSKLQSVLKAALAHHQAGRWVEAEKLYREARLGAPRSFDAFHLSGALAYQQGRGADAVNLFSHALKLDRKSVICGMRLGMALMVVGRNAEAETKLRDTIKISPDYFEVWDKLAYCLKVQDRLAEALVCHEKTVALKPDFAMGWYNYGLTLVLMGRPLEALSCHDHALAVDPTYALARFGRAQTLFHLNRIDECVADYRQFLQVQPDNHEARSNLLFALHALESISREELFAEHVAFGRAVGSPVTESFTALADPHRRLRVAILSPDLRNHSCAYFLEPLLQHLDPADFELYLYHDHFREDETSLRLRGLAAVWRNFVGQPHAAVEQAIRADAPDILIDLAGHTGMGNKLPLFARRLAPVQMTYLGYPNTTGVPAMDYRLTDAVADPAGEADAFATEQLVRFAPTAWTYAPPTTAPAVNSLPALATGQITFGCFNNLTKVTDAMLRTWSAVLQAVPDSRLLLKGHGLSDAAVRERFLARLLKAGLARERVMLLERTPDTTSHLAVYHQVDIALDTFPYNGTTTTCESLWMGVPVVSLAGDRHMARVSASLLHAVGHPEWVATTDEGYVQAAATLAADRVQLAEIRGSLRDGVRASPLMDHAGQAKRFGAALRESWKKWCVRQVAKAA